MHQTRQEVTRKIPIERKGTKYVARASSNTQNSIPVVVAMRDVLSLAKTAKEVKALIHNKALKLNGRLVRDLNEPIMLFNILEADKKYKLVLLETGRFSFEPTKDNERLCKVMSRVLVSENRMQLNMHDGTNIIGSKDIKVGDSIYVSFDGKIKSHISLDKARECVVISGKYSGNKGKISSIDKENKTAIIKFKDRETELKTSSVVAI
jgi:small subunit ribosomal protein S4e